MSLIDTDAKKEHWLGVWRNLSEAEKNTLKDLSHIEDIKSLIDYCEAELS